MAARRHRNNWWSSGIKKPSQQELQQQLLLHQDADASSSSSFLQSSGYTIPRYWSMITWHYTDAKGNQYRRLDALELGSSVQLEEGQESLIGMHVRSPTHARIDIQGPIVRLYTAPTTRTMLLFAQRQNNNGASYTRLEDAAQRDAQVESFYTASCGTHGVLWCKLL